MDQGYGRPITAGNGDAHARPIVDVRIDDREAQRSFDLITPQL
jgi:hypothetical protein